MRRYWLAWLLGLITLVPSSGPAFGFGGFYVARADSRLFNQTAKVVLTRHEGKTVITMVNDYQGALEEFAVLVPVPSVLERGQIHVTARAIVDRLDAYTAPRLVKDVDDNPCGGLMAGQERQSGPGGTAPRDRADALGVTVEATYAVGEYDIEVLSAEQSDGLAAWLRSRGYRLPDRAGESWPNISPPACASSSPGSISRSRASSGTASCGHYRWRSSPRTSCCRSVSAR